MSEHWFPLDADEHALQVAEVLELLSGERSKVIDLGCGDGRVAIELATRGHQVIAIDRDAAAIRAIKSRRHENIVALEKDFLSLGDVDLRDARGARGAVCLGHTFMLVAVVEDAIRLLRTLREVIRPGGFFAIDSFCRDVWRDVAEGNWQEGTSEDGTFQLVWSESDEVIAIRSGDDVDESAWQVREPDAPLRLWSMGSLTLLARASGWNDPRESDNHALIVFQRPLESL